MCCVPIVCSRIRQCAAKTTKYARRDLQIVRFETYKLCASTWCLTYQDPIERAPLLLLKQSVVIGRCPESVVELFTLRDWMSLKVRAVNTTLRNVLLVCLLALLPSQLLATQPSIEELHNLVRVALQTSTPASNELCAYSMRTTGPNGDLVQERFDSYFGDNKAWSLVRVAGSAPTAEQLDHYEPPLRQRHPAVVSFQFIDMESLELTEETAAGLVFSFDVEPGLGHSANSVIKNTLLVDPITAQLKQIRRVSDADFRVGKFAKISEFESTSTFRRDSETKSLVLSSSTTRLKSRIGRETIDQRLHIEFDEFDCSTVPVEVTEQQESELERPQLQDPPPSTKEVSDSDLVP